jgi:hypothetical protein
MCDKYKRLKNLLWKAIATDEVTSHIRKCDHCANIFHAGSWEVNRLKDRIAEWGQRALAMMPTQPILIAETDEL